MKFKIMNLYYEPLLLLVPINRLHCQHFWTQPNCSVEVKAPDSDTLCASHGNIGILSSKGLVSYEEVKMGLKNNSKRYEVVEPILPKNIENRGILIEPKVEKVSKNTKALDEKGKKS